MSVVKAKRSPSRAGLHFFGGRRPIIFIQCTGVFEAGDALRNFIHDLKLPLFIVVGVRSWLAHQQGASTDTCPVFTEFSSILRGLAITVCPAQQQGQQ